MHLLRPIFIVSLMCMWARAGSQGMAGLAPLDTNGMLAPPQAFLSISVGSVQPAYPVVGLPRLLYLTAHPAMEVCYEKLYARGSRWRLGYRVGVGAFYHRFIQTAVTLSGSGVARLRLGSRFSAEAALGAGYLHSFPLTYTYQQQADGQWRRTNRYGRPQACITLAPAVSYLLGQREENALRLSLRYLVLLQTPFVPGFVPLLPYNGLYVTLSKPF